MRKATYPNAAPAFPSLSVVANFGPRELTYPPHQSILPGVKSWMNHPYAMVEGHRMLRLDLHVPQHAKGPVPLVVYASGGGWRLVGKHHGPWKFLPLAGYAVASIEYRLYGEATFPTPIHDLKAAVRWLRANASQYGLDPARIAGWGSSAGGYLMSMSAATNGVEHFEGTVGECADQSSALACVIDHYGPTDFLALPNDFAGVSAPMQEFGILTSFESQFLGYVPRERPDEAASASVATHVTAQTVPFLIMHGDADTVVGVNQSRRLHDALRSAGADAELHILPGANHNGPEFDTESAHGLALEFLRRTLGPGTPDCV